LGCGIDVGGLQKHREVDRGTQNIPAGDGKLGAAIKVNTKS
jgi:hypothetical protein